MDRGSFGVCEFLVLVANCQYLIARARDAKALDDSDCPIGGCILADGRYNRDYNHHYKESQHGKCDLFEDIPSMAVICMWPDLEFYFLKSEIHCLQRLHPLEHALPKTLSNWMESSEQ